MKPKTKKLVILFAALALALGFAAAELQKSVRVVVSTGTAKGQPDVAYDAQAERYLVVWQERAASGDDRDIRARVVNRDGTPASDIVALASSGEDERLPKTAATGSSSWTVVWSTGTSIEACTVDATGKASDFRTVDATPSRPVDRPDIGACSSDSAFLVVWEELDETGLTVIKGRRIRAPSGTDGEEFLLARSSEHDLRNPSVNRSGSGSFVAWEKPVEVRRADIEGRFVPADAASGLDLGQVLTIAADGARNTVPQRHGLPRNGRLPRRLAEFGRPPRFRHLLRQRDRPRGPSLREAHGHPRLPRDAALRFERRDRRARPHHLSDRPFQHAAAARDRRPDHRLGRCGGFRRDRSGPDP